MKILRNGQEFELTSDELYRAYIEQQNLFDRENIENNMEDYLDPVAYAMLKDNEDFIEDATYDLRRNQDKYDMTFEYALDDAIRNAKQNHCKFIFDQEITMSDDGTQLDGYLWATDALVSQLKAEMQNKLSDAELLSMENINFYPVYDVTNNSIQLCGHFYYESEKGTVGHSFEISLTPKEAGQLISGFEAYCQEEVGMTCREFINQFRGNDEPDRDVQKSLTEQIQSAQTKTNHPDQKTQPEKDYVL